MGKIKKTNSKKYRNWIWTFFIGLGLMMGVYAVTTITDLKVDSPHGNYTNLTVRDLNVTGNASVFQNFTVDINTLFVDSNSNRVGIGTASPNELLHVSGNAEITGALTGGGSGHDQFSDFVSNEHFDTSTLTTGSIVFSDGTTFREDNVNLFYDNTGNRLGLGTVSPSKAIHISKGIPTIRLSDSDAGTDQAVATLISFFRGDDDNRVGFWGMASSSNDVMALATDYAAGEFSLRTGSNVVAMFIDSSQKVGIGTTNPQDILNIIGTTNTTTFVVTDLNAASCDLKSTTNGTFFCGTDATGSSSNIFDQVLNTTSNVTFNNLTLTEDLIAVDLIVSGQVETGTIFSTGNILLTPTSGIRGSVTVTSTGSGSALVVGDTLDSGTINTGSGDKELGDASVADGDTNSIPTGDQVYDFVIGFNDSLDSYNTSLKSYLDTKDTSFNDSIVVWNNNRFVTNVSLNSTVCDKVVSAYSNGSFICGTDATGASANIFNQVLNTTSNVTFYNTTLTGHLVPSTDSTSFIGRILNRFFVGFFDRIVSTTGNFTNLYSNDWTNFSGTSNQITNFNLSLDSYNTSLKNYLDTKDTIFNDSLQVYVIDADIDANTTLKDWIDAQGFSTNAVTNNSGVYKLNFSSLKSQDWTNVTIISNQVSNFNLSLDSYNTSIKVYLDEKDSAFNNTIPDSQVVDTITITSSGQIGNFNLSLDSYNTSLKNYLDTKDIIFNDSMTVYVDQADIDANTTLKDWIDGQGFITSGVINNTGVYKLNFSSLKSQDWTNVTITSNQVSNFNLSLDSYNTSLKDYLDTKDTAFNNTIPDSQVVDSLTISSSGSVADGALSSNICLLNGVQTFTAEKSFTADVNITTNLNVSGTIFIRHTSTNITSNATCTFIYGSTSALWIC